MDNVITLEKIIKAITERFKLLVRKVKMASTGSCYLKIKTNLGVKVIRVSDHKAGKNKSQNWLDIRTDRTEHHGGKTLPACDIDLIFNTIETAL